MKPRGAQHVAPLQRKLERQYKQRGTGTACRARTSVAGDRDEMGRNVLRPYKGLGAEEDGFALEGLDSDEDGGGAIDAGRAKD